MTDDTSLPFDEDELITAPAEFSAVKPSAESTVESTGISVTSGEPAQESSRVIRIRSGSARSAAGDGSSSTASRVGRSSEPLTMRSRRGVALLAVGALVFLAGAGTLVNRGATANPAVPTVEPVASTELVCPITVASKNLTSTITAAVAPLSTVSAGRATLANLVKAGKPSDPLVIKSAGSLVARVIDGESGPAQVARAIGSYATGFGADQSVRSGSGSTRGMAIAPCSRSLTDAWLVGGEATLGRTTTIMLVNNDDRPAQVDLKIYGFDGPIDSPAASGIAIPAASTLRLPLASLAPGEAVTAVNVIATEGRVGATALEFDARGLVPQGISAMSPTLPGRSLVIPMIPASMISVRLVLLSPGSDATVQIKLLTDQGAITPVGFDSVDVTADRVLGIDVTKALDGGAGGLLITSDRDVVAGTIITTGAAGGYREVDREAATVALTSPGLITGLAGANIKHQLGIAAPAAAAVVKVELFVAGTPAAAWTRTVTVKSGSIFNLTVPVTTAKASSMVLVTPISGGPAYVTRVEIEKGQNGPIMGLAPLIPTRASTLVPPVELVPGSSVLGGP